VAQGDLFIATKNGLGERYPAQDGPMILDGEGRPVWFRPVLEESHDAMDFKVQRYRGEPVLTGWQGVHGGWGNGEYLIFDRSYREVARVRAGNGLAGDHHEFLVTERDTALFTIYRGVPMDLSAAGGPKQVTVMDGIVQEVDIETGEVLFEWHSLEHVGFEESTTGPNPDQRDAYDYFHINSVAEDNGRAGRLSGASAGRGATSRWARGPVSPSSTTPAARKTAPSPSSTTGARTWTSPRAGSASGSTRRP
jgi:hypothetical protein